jgi:hypothetical protein
MRIEDLPRPWLLAAVTGVPMSALLDQAEHERAEKAERAWQKMRGEQYRWSATGRPVMAPRIRLRRLAL